MDEKRIHEGRTNFQNLADYLNQQAINGFNYRTRDHRNDQTPPILFKVIESTDIDSDVPYALAYGEQYAPPMQTDMQRSAIEQTLSPIGGPLPGSPGLYTSMVQDNPSYRDGQRHTDERGTFLLSKIALQGGRYQEWWTLANPNPAIGTPTVVGATATQPAGSQFPNP